MAGEHCQNEATFEGDRNELAFSTALSLSLDLRVCGMPSDNVKEDRNNLAFSASFLLSLPVLSLLKGGSDFSDSNLSEESSEEDSSSGLSDLGSSDSCAGEKLLAHQESEVREPYHLWWF